MTEKTITIDLSQLYKGIKDLEKFDKLLTDGEDKTLAIVGKSIATQITRRTQQSKTIDGTTMKGIKVSSLLGSSRSKSLKKKWRKKDKDERVPVATARPLLSGMLRAARPQVLVSTQKNGSSVIVAPTMGPGTTVDGVSILAYHQRPVISGHAITTGTQVDRTTWGITKDDEKRAYRALDTRINSLLKAV